MKKVEILKSFFGTLDKPVLNAELMDFIKNDRKGYDELVSLAATSLGVKIDGVKA